MFGRIKNWLGIDGVKVEIELNDEIDQNATSVDGNLLFYSKRPQVVEHINIKLIEKYTRGRRRNKLINVYTLGTMDYTDIIHVPEEQFIQLEFSLPFERLKSDMDRYAEMNFVTRGLIDIAKRIKNAKSEYRLEVSVKVKGTAMSPLVKKPIYFS